MKRNLILTILLISGLLLVGCDKKESSNNKNLCLEQRDSYLEYIKSRENIDDKIPENIFSISDGVSYKDLIRFDMFYSDSFDICIAWYWIYDIYPSWNGHDADTMYFMYDALNDKQLNWWSSIRWDSASLWYINDLEYYRTWKWELANWDPSWMPYD